ncbi:hypothetical protein LIER_20111 [Lithospermum erythrorhizon]|uniref:Uncharacterized protein n=1 Tax=Lithospermum erythrorhizon TaxID=34254 RepID=A0AAV3QNA8_LITER
MSVKSVDKVNSKSTANFTVDSIAITASQGEDSSRTNEQHQLPVLEEQQHSYAAAVGGRKALRMKLTYIPPEEIDGKAVVRYQSIDVIRGVNRWRSSVFGYVIGLNLVSLQLRNLRRLDGVILGLKKSSSLHRACSCFNLLKNLAEII